MPASRRITCTLLMALLLLAPIADAHDLSKVVAKMDQSVARVTHTAGVCTGFSINQELHYVLTAYHCLLGGTDEGLRVWGHPARVEWVSPELDLAVISVDGWTAPGLVPSRGTLRKGEMIGALGFGYGMIESLFRAGYVSHPVLTIESLGASALLIFDGPYIPGMSGGPVFDTKGRVVGIVQMSDPLSGIGRGIDQVFKATSRFWGEQAWN